MESDSRIPDDLDLLVQLMPGDVQRAFRLLEVGAEEADRYKGVTSALWSALQPPGEFMRLDPRVYRSHVGELLVRAELGARLDLVTDAELLIGLQEASLKAPLHTGALVLYHHLFRVVVGPEALEELLDGAEPPKPAWPTQVLDELERLKRKTSPHRRPRFVEAIQRKKTPPPLEDR